MIEFDIPDQVHILIYVNSYQKFVAYNLDYNLHVESDTESEAILDLRELTEGHVSRAIDLGKEDELIQPAHGTFWRYYFLALESKYEGGTAMIDFGDEEDEYSDLEYIDSSDLDIDGPYLRRCKMDIIREPQVIRLNAIDSVLDPVEGDEVPFQDFSSTYEWEDRMTPKEEAELEALVKTVTAGVCV